jgi:hypothetical protein
MGAVARRIVHRRGKLALACAAALLLGPVGAAQAAGPPEIGASWVTDVTSTSANLRASINANGEPTTYRFEYVSEAAYQANLNAIPPREGFFGAAKAPPSGAALLGSATTPLNVVQHVGGLSPNTVYRYRPVATNSSAPPGGVVGPEHALITQETGVVFHLPDGRGWEMVSPVDKNGGAIAAPGALFGGGEFQAATGGGAVTYSSSTAFGAAPGAPPGSQYLSRRVASGWTTQDISAPLQSGGYGDEPDGVPYRIFSTDLARALLLNPRRCDAGEPCPRTYSLRESSNGALTPLPPEAAGMRVLSASSDLSQVLFEDEAEEVFAWSGGGLAPISLLPATAGPGATFQLSTADGGFTFYTEGGHLYRYDAASETATDLTPSGGVAGVLGASAAGDYVYYQDAGGLRQWHSGATATIEADAAAAKPSDFLRSGGTARVSADGTRLLFLSEAEVGGFDNVDADTGLPDTELYLYGPPPGGGSAQLLCVSCNPAGERPQGSASIPGALVNGSTAAYLPRVLSANGTRVFFDSSDELVLQDTDSATDVYQWEAQGTGDCVRPRGCIGLISGGREDGGTFVDASAGGTDVYFITEDSLVAADPGSIDLYDARVGGGFPVPNPPIACIGDACQALPSPPDDPTPGTLTRNSGNPPVKYYRERSRKHRKHKRRRHRHGKHGGRHDRRAGQGQRGRAR